MRNAASVASTVSGASESHRTPRPAMNHALAPAAASASTTVISTRDRARLADSGVRFRGSAVRLFPEPVP